MEVGVRIFTNANSLFNDKNTSCLLRFLSSAMSLSRRSACSSELAIYPSLPLTKSLMEASEGRGAPSSTYSGFQSGTLGCHSVVTSKLILSRALFFQWSQAVLASLACLLGGWPVISPSSTESLPCFLSFFLFFSAGLKVLTELESQKGPPPHNTLKEQRG